jgi:hypothetical protein
MNACEKAIDILERTNDGRLLFQSELDVERHGHNGDGWQLKLLESAVNNFLTARGKEVFDALHRQVLAGDYLYDHKTFVEKFCPEAVNVG